MAAAPKGLLSFKLNHVQVVKEFTARQHLFLFFFYHISTIMIRWDLLRNHLPLSQHLSNKMWLDSLKDELRFDYHNGVITISRDFSSFKPKSLLYKNVLDFRQNFLAVLWPTEISGSQKLHYTKSGFKMQLI